jgi:hypothetical protein
VNPKSGQVQDLAAQLRSAAEDLARARGWTCRPSSQFQLSQTAAGPCFTQGDTEPIFGGWQRILRTLYGVLRSHGFVLSQESV